MKPSQIPECYLSVSDDGNFSLIYKELPLTSGSKLKDCLKTALKYKIEPTHVWDGKDGTFTDFVMVQ